MSVLPTLMVRGKLVNSAGEPDPGLANWIPYEYILNWFSTRLDLSGTANRVLVLRSETASGKSTLLPPKILEEFIIKRGIKGGIICTQPRIYTAISNVQEMLANNKFLRPGQNIGWSTKPDKLKPAKYGLTSATIGTLAQQLKTLTDEQIADRYKFILIDETHERDLQTDMTIYMLKSLLLRMGEKKNCPFVVLMSATFSPEIFLRYFNVTLDNFIWCRGEAAGFDEEWEWNGGAVVTNYPESAAAVVKRICDSGDADEPERGDVLIFLPGAPEMIATGKHLSALNLKYATAGIKGGSGPVCEPLTQRVCPITGGDCKCMKGVPRGVSGGDNVVGDTPIGGGSTPVNITSTRVFTVLSVSSDDVKKDSIDIRNITTRLQDQTVIIEVGSSKLKFTPSRRIIMVTNVAETGVTIPSLKYVIDAGFNREVIFNPVIGVSALLTLPAPQSRINQRRGRAGRKFRGVFYPLYTREIYNKLPPLSFPKIITEDILGVILDIIFEQLRAKSSRGEPPEFVIADIDMLEPPTPDAIGRAIETLYTIGFICHNPPVWRGPTLQDAREMETDGDPSPVISGLVPSLGFTRLGAIAAVVSTPTLGPEFLRAIFSAYSWGADPADLITIAAYSSTEPDRGLAADREEPIKWSIIYETAFGDADLYMIAIDEMINGIALFRAVIKTMSGENPISALDTYCAQVGVNRSAVMTFVNAREELINHFLENEFLVFTGAGGNPIDMITRIKYCLWDGFKTRQMHLNEKTGRYTARGIEIMPPKFLRSRHKDIELNGKIKPKCLITTGFSCKYNRKLDIYQVMPSLVSAMDGFVPWK